MPKHYTPKSILCFCLAFCVLCSLAVAQGGRYNRWQSLVVAQDQLSASDIQYRQLFYRNDYTNKRFTIHVVILPPGTYRATILDQTSFIRYFGVADITSITNGFLGINGGFYDKSFQPLGLYILNGHIRAPLSNSRLLSGVVVINSRGRLSLMSRNGSYRDARFAIQAGPWIIRPGGRRGIRRASLKVRTRTVLAQAPGNRLVVLSASPVTLYDLAGVLSKYPKDFGVSRIAAALNLDGGRSTAMTLRTPVRSFSMHELSPVRNIIVFSTPRD